MKENDGFISSLRLNDHPMADCKAKVKEGHYLAIEYVVSRLAQNDIVRGRFDIYKSFFHCHARIKKEKNSISVLRRYCHSRHRKYLLCLLCDIQLITLDNDLTRNAFDLLHELLKRRFSMSFTTFTDILKGRGVKYPLYKFVLPLIDQYLKNVDFIADRGRRFIVTANISAGKSTLINAIIGKPITSMSQEICTGNINCIYNKPYEDDRIHLRTDIVSLSASSGDIKQAAQERDTEVAVYFRSEFAREKRVCIIDTPGVNDAINQGHRSVTYNTLSGGQYDKVICILDANKLGTNDEITHLDWISKHIPKDKVIFVVNKLDCFKASTDNISESIGRIKADLLKLGFTEPVICPISAYFALLIKKKANGDAISKYELNDYDLFSCKFQDAAYDLSGYYADCDDNCSGELLLIKKCGLYGLENLLFGG